MLRVAFVVNSFKKNFFEQMIRTFPSGVESFLLDVGACFSSKGWLLPSRQLLRQLGEIKPDAVYTDYPHYPVWYAKIHKVLSRKNVPVVAHLAGTGGQSTMAGLQQRPTLTEFSHCTGTTSPTWHLPWLRL